MPPTVAAPTWSRAAGSGAPVCQAPVSTSYTRWVVECPWPPTYPPSTWIREPTTATPTSLTASGSGAPWLHCARVRSAGLGGAAGLRDGALLPAVLGAVLAAEEAPVQPARPMLNASREP